MTDPNERMMALIPWRGQICECAKAAMTALYNTGNTRGYKEMSSDPKWAEFEANPPRDFTQWHHFPEMQEYVRGLDAERMSEIEARLINELKMGGLGTYHEDFGMWTITPTILRDAILATVGEEVSV